MGISIDRDAERAIAKTLMTTEHGELRSQCRSVDVIWVIYLGQLPGEDERMWFEERRHLQLEAKRMEHPILVLPSTVLTVCAAVQCTVVRVMFYYAVY